jgi:hypothetical protein
MDIVRNSHASIGWVAIHRYMVLFAEVLGFASDVTTWTTKADACAAAYHKRWYNASVNGYSAGCQTSNVMALYLPGVVPTELVPTVVKSLVDDIRKHGNHTTSGIVGGASCLRVSSLTTAAHRHRHHVSQRATRVSIEAPSHSTRNGLRAGTPHPHPTHTHPLREHPHTPTLREHHTHRHSGNTHTHTPTPTNLFRH